MSRQKADDMSDMFRMTPDAFAATLHSDERAVTSEEMDAIPHFNRWHHAAKLKLPWLPDAWEFACSSAVTSNITACRAH
jgi:hypothetical protein